MSIESIQPLISGATSIERAETGGAAKPGFADWLGDNITALNDKLVGAETALTQLATGETGNLHHVMLELQKTKLEFQLALQIRNKALEGYQEIMRMQI